MSNRSRYVAAGAAAAGAALVARREARLRRAAAGIRDAILPAAETEAPSRPARDVDESHAPGHQHVRIVPVDEPRPQRLRGRPWTKHAHGMRHPFSGD